MSNIVENFWESFVPTAVKEARFGWIPSGECVVEIVDVRPLRATNDFSIDDNMKIHNITIKSPEKFDPAFDQDILCLVYKDSGGRILVDRRSSIGWLTNDDATATPEMIQKYGLTSSGKRFTKNGIGIPSKRDADQPEESNEIGGKTKSCLDIANRLFQACGTSGIDELVGKKMKIVVVATKNGNKEDRKVVNYYAPEAIIKAKADVKPAETQKAKPAQPADDDLPF